MALPRQWAVSPPMEIDEEKNRVPGHRDAKEHVASIFDDVIPKMCKKGVAIDVIGMGDGGPIIAEYLQGNWENWKGQVKAAAIGSGSIWQGDKIVVGDFVKFWEEVSWTCFDVWVTSIADLFNSGAAHSSVHSVR